MLPSSTSIDGRSSSLSSSSISSSSSNSSFSLLPNNNPKTMEEVWKDITIASLPNTPIIPHTIHHPTPTSSHHFRGKILQDFFNNNNGVEETNQSNIRSSNLEFLSPPHNPPENTTTHHHEFQFFDHNNHQFSKQGSSFVSGFLGFNNAGGYDALDTFGGGGGHGGGCGSDGGAGGVAVTNNRKRVSEIGGGEDEDESVERRHKRMIKNRESAARSRARKQAYITELELEVDQLSKENAMLRKQHRQFIQSPPSHQLPKKYGLHRTSTAPF